jgi:hypothetical protein
MPDSSGSSHIISASAKVAAPPERVYAAIADYQNGHPNIVPPQFSDLVVEQGGYGAGTIIRFKMKVFGRTQSFRAAITEPEPGRVLVETGLDDHGAVTTFTVDPESDTASRVTITTELAARTGIAGKLERYLSTVLLRPIYDEELKILNKWVTQSA